MAGLRFFPQALSEAHRDVLDARVPLLRGSNHNPHVAGLLTDGAPPSPTKGGNNGGGGGGGGGGLRLQLDAPEHLCDVLSCQLPAENFWQKGLPDGSSSHPPPKGGRGRGRRGGGGRAAAVDDGSGGSQDAPAPPPPPPPPVAKSSSWW